MAASRTFFFSFCCSLVSFVASAASVRVAARRVSKVLRKNCAVRLTAVRSPVSTSTPICTSASSTLSGSFSYTP